jgi:uncharacterized membrane protein
MKNPFTSVTIIGIAIAAASNFLPAVGIEVNQDAAIDLAERVKAAYPEIVEAIGLIVALVGRWRATQPLSFSKKD